MCPLGLSPNHELSPEELKKALALLLNHLLKMSGDKMSSEKKEELVNGLVNIFTDPKQQPFSLQAQHLMDPNFIKKLSIALVTSLTLDKNDSLASKLKLLFGAKKKLDLKDPDALKKILSPEEKKKLHLAMTQFHAELLKEFKKFGLADPKPTPGGKKPLEEKLTDEAFTNLTGLISAGGIAAVVPVFLGNPGFVDWSPFHESSFSQLAQQDKVSDTQYGDPLGLNAALIRNLAAEGEGVDDLQERFRQNHLIPGGPPTLTQGH